MGALSLYRGNLHRVADIPRRWPMPPRAISLAQFRHLLRKRNLAIAQFSSLNNPNGKPNPRVSNEKHDDMDKTGCPKEDPINCVSSSEPSRSALNDGKGIVAIAEDRLALEGVDSMDDGDRKEQVICKLDLALEKEERKRDFEQKLHVLNEKKHYLVQMLKQACLLLHQRYKDFSPSLIQGLLKVFSPGKSVDDLEADKSLKAMKKRSTLKLLMELYFVGVVEDASIFVNIIKDFTGLEQLKDRDATQTNLSLLTSFARQGRFFLGMHQPGQEVDESSIRALM